MKPNANKQNGKPTDFADKILLGQNLAKDKCAVRAKSCKCLTIEK